MDASRAVFPHSDMPPCCRILLLPATATSGRCSKQVCVARGGGAAAAAALLHPVTSKTENGARAMSDPRRSGEPRVTGGASLGQILPSRVAELRHPQTRGEENAIDVKTRSVVNGLREGSCARDMQTASSHSLRWVCGLRCSCSLDGPAMPGGRVAQGVPRFRVQPAHSCLFASFLGFCRVLAAGVPECRCGVLQGMAPQNAVSWAEDGPGM